MGNPDIVAPREDGLTLEPGYYAHDLHRRTGIKPEFYGKPYANIFDLVFDRISPDTPKSRIAMVGDTLHTDVLGGAAYGVQTVLIENHGLFAGNDVDGFIKHSGIIPNWICPDT